MANSVDPDQTAPTGAVCSGSTLFAPILNLSIMLGNYLQQTTSADDIFRCIFFLGALRVNLPNSTDPDQRPQNAAFNQGILCSRTHLNKLNIPSDNQTAQVHGGNTNFAIFASDRDGTA